ncbi:MAG TPA: S53 family peptidase, partial [Acidimicrobiales bacterium]|nr:S53 family peptidase [Acidimicrobiales bacterium]
IGVDGGANSPGAASGPDGEVMLDLEVVGSVAPGARIAVYFAPNTDQGFLDAVSTAVHDTTNHPSVVSISWGSAEVGWTPQAMTQMEDTFATAATLGVTVTVAAGDSGSGDGVGDGRPHVDFPASAPHALGCGGTTLELAGGAIRSEVVWDDLASGGGATGGGVSAVFGPPAWQASAGVPPVPGSGGRYQPTGGRGVPDVAGDADPRTGYEIRVDGLTEAIGGTSAVAPLWAALVARLNQGLGRDLGFVNPHLYALGLPSGAAPDIVHDITVGSNGAWSAGPGWDPCTGLGSPDGAALLAALQALPATGA